MYIDITKSPFYISMEAVKIIFFLFKFAQAQSMTAPLFNVWYQKYTLLTLQQRMQPPFQKSTWGYNYRFFLEWFCKIRKKKVEKV